MRNEYRGEVVTMAVRIVVEKATIHPRREIKWKIY